MGEVYQAVDSTLGRPVALKRVRDGEPEHLARLMLEAQALARMDHPNICPVHEVGQFEGRPFLAMRLVPGESLATLAPRLSLEAKVALMRTVAEAMHAAHRLGLIHRDLKPSNLMAEAAEDGTWIPVVLDFGLVRDAEGPDLTRTGMPLGTPGFMSPEQAQGEHGLVDRRSDVFGLGATLYALLTGQPPFAGPTPLEALRRLLEEEPQRPSRLVKGLPSTLDTILLKCLEKNPARRYDTAKALAEDLGRFLAGEPILAVRPSWRARAHRFTRRHRAASLVAASALVLLAAMGAWFLRVRIADEQRSELLRQLVQEAERQEGRLRAAFLLPLHDLRVEEAEVRAWMDSVRQLPGNPRPAAFALGRGHLLLREYEPARRELQRAWDEGLRGPEVALPLAYVLGELYQQRMTDLWTEGDPALRGPAEAKLAATLRDPALRLIQDHAEGRASQRAYLQGLMALHQGRYAEAARLADEASHLEPGLFEARFLEGRAWFAQAQRQARSATAEEAFPLWERAREAYVRALDMARSHPDLLAALGTLDRNVHQFSLNPVQAPEDGFRKVIASLQRALQADPGHLTTHLELVRTWLRLGYAREDRGRSPEEAYGTAMEVAQEAVARHPRSVEAWAYQGLVGVDLAEHALAHGSPNHGALREQAAGSFRRAKELEPTHYSLLDNYIWLLVSRAREAQAPTATQKANAAEALAVGERLIASKDGAYDAHFALGAIHGLLARHLAGRPGEDPSPAFTLALDHARKALAMIPRNTLGHANLARILLWRAEHERSQGRNPAADLEEGLKLTRAALAENAWLMTHHDLRGALLRVKAEAAMDRQQDPSGFLKEAESLLRRALTLDPRHQDHLAHWAQLQGTLARWRAQPKP